MVNKNRIRNFFACWTIVTLLMGLQENDEFAKKIKFTSSGVMLIITIFLHIKVKRKNREN